MASLFSTTATLFCGSTNTIPKLSVAKTLSNSRCSNLTGPFTVLDAESSILANTLRKLKPYGLATLRFFQQNKPLTPHSQFRAYVEGGSGNTPDAEDDKDGDGVEHSIEETCDLPPDSENQEDNIEVEIEKTGKNSRRIRSKVAIQASLQAVWDILTDYERLADFIPGLAVCQLLDKRENFARLFQKDLQTLPFGQKRDIEFKMVEGDFQLFEGKWSVEQEVKWNAGDLPSDSVVGQEFQTTLMYIVNVKPKMWLPVRLVEGRLCKEIRTNLSCIRDEAEKAFRNTPSAL
ncbi:hypothetical protein DH2020_014064 [Rehmannia glutinosa]|uniref:Coenzyme Q-binding protein COQ10 START domain-containing protein n=1 Tax=Rehmannia glutinosa TaxID=99300 RepID=A0ABR0WYU4_REHGL